MLIRFGAVPTPVFAQPKDGRERWDDLAMPPGGQGKVYLKTAVKAAGPF